jgi:hypothetical protein
MALAVCGVPTTAVVSQAMVGSGSGVHGNRCLLDLRALGAEQDTVMQDGVLACTS